jgi:hypothetical protein
MRTCAVLCTLLLILGSRWFESQGVLEQACMILQLRTGLGRLVRSFAQIAGGTTQHVLLITHGCGGIPGRR